MPSCTLVYILDLIYTDHIEIDISSIIEHITKLLCIGSNIHNLTVDDLQSTVSADLSEENLTVDTLLAVDYPFLMQ